MSYRVFKRTWWKENSSYPNGLEPCPGPKRYVSGATFDTEQEARDFCKLRNAEPQSIAKVRLSLKYEYESV